MAYSDELGDQLKVLEMAETARRFDTTKPVYARIDGRGFSKFTSKMEKPFDKRVNDAMRNAMHDLIRQTGADVGYVQSDEISLGWLPIEPPTQFFFDAKAQKLLSVLSGIATSSFFFSMLDWPPLELSKYGAMKPHFDCRIFQPDDVDTLTACFLWREEDATRNAVQGLAQEVFTHTELQFKTTGEVLRMLWAEGIDIRDLPVAYRRGLYANKRGELDMGLLRDTLNPVEVLFHGAEPIVKPEPDDTDGEGSDYADETDDDQLIQG